MRLFIADSFYDQLFNLPVQIQRKTIEFQKKFRQASTSAAIHLEPIEQFKDPNLRSARIDQKYRVIIATVGDDNYLLVYVGNHDDAYRWGLNKKVEWNVHTQSVQVLTVAEQEIAATPAPAPDVQATVFIFKDISDEQLLAIGVPDGMLERVRTISDFDDLDAMEDNLSEDVFERIFNLLDGESIDSIIQEIQDGLAAFGEDQMLSGNNMRHFIEIVDDDDLEKMVDSSMEKWQLFLHPSQRNLVEANYPGSMKVSGGAGTGKTVAALHRLKKLTLVPSSKVLFTTFTTALRDNLKKQIVKLDVPSQRYELDNIDQVVLKLARTYGILPEGYKVLDYEGGNLADELWKQVLEFEASEFDEKFLSEEYTNVIGYNNITEQAQYLRQSRVGRSKPVSRRQRIDIWHLVEKYNALKESRKRIDRVDVFNRVTDYLNKEGVRPYTNVIADEFQDFSNPELRFLRALVAEGPNDLFMTGDPIQRIYSGRKLNFSQAGINVRGKKSRRLKVNYRTTDEIRKVALAIIKGEMFEDFDGGEESTKGYISLMHGAKPAYNVFPTRDAEFAGIVGIVRQLLDGGGYSGKDICIAAYSRQTLRDITNVLHNNGIKYSDGRVQDADGVTLCTFHSIKGLEFRVVIVVGIDNRFLSPDYQGQAFDRMDKVEKKDYLKGLRSLLYVALTRAQREVYITCVNNKCELLQNL